MDPNHWHRVRELFEAVAEFSPADRAAFIRDTCGEDTTLRADVERLLEADTNASEFLTAPALLAETSVADRSAPQQVGPYYLDRLVGEGGMAQVYLAHRTDDADPVAIKLIRPGLGSEEVVARFRREQQILASLNHPNISRLLDAGVSDHDEPYVVMDYFDGVPIDRFCDDGHLSIDERVKLFSTVCSAVQYAHDRGILHRDLKPSNVLVTSNGAPQVLDFGIAKLLKTELSQEADLTRTGRRALTPDYASPEQILGKPVNARSDVYSLGVILYELLAGRPPYQIGPGTLDDIVRVLEVPPSQPSKVVSNEPQHAGLTETATRAAISEARGTTPFRLRYRLAGDLDSIALKALAKEPEDRYGSVNQLREDLGRYLQHRPILARRHSVAYLTSRLLLRKRAAFSAAIRNRAARRAPSADVQEQLARISKLNSLGAVLAEAGETTEALHNFEQALRIADEMTEIQSPSPEMWKNVSVSCNRMGVTAARLGNRYVALKLFRRALFANESLTAEDTRDARARRNIVGNSKNIAVLQEMLASEQDAAFPERLRRFEMARTWYRRALETAFEMQREGLARSEEEGSPIELAYSLRACEEAISKLRSLHDKPGLRTER